MKGVAENLKGVLARLPEGVGLTAVSKFHPVEVLMEAYAAGQRVFGESRVRELQEKTGRMPGDVQWHFIGHVQSNKVRALVGEPVALIESVDSERLLELIDRESERVGKVSRVLLQVHVAREETKFGFGEDELLEYFRRGGYRGLKATHLCGVMGMASNTDDMVRVEDDFRRIAGIAERILEICGDELRGFDVVSMGMSDDYELAVRCGSTQVRVGTAIFGEREY